MDEIDELNWIRWLGHDSFLFAGENGKKTVYIDPFKLEQVKLPKADIVLITHGHYDHCSIKDIMKVSTPETTILITPDCQSKISEFAGEVVLVEPNKKYNVKELEIQTVAAYNTNKVFHPRDNGWVGYIFTFNEKRIYHAGDTDLIPEMQIIQNIDIALLPVSGTYVMNSSEAAQAANMIRPKIAIPMHYGEIIGNENDAKDFKRECMVDVKILEKE